jgi:hypothetical protein
MTVREKRLAGAVVAAGVLWVATKGVDRYRAALEENVETERTAAAALDDAEFAEARGMRAKRRLNEWSERSLPTDRDVAKSLYHDWLRKELVAAGLTVEQLADKPLGRGNQRFGELAVDVRAAGTLAQLADFLYKFYAAPHLHRIGSATLTPSDAGAKVTAALGIEALVLADCPRRDKLAEGPAQELPLSQEDMRKSLVDRNMFAAYTGPAGDSGDAEAGKAVVRQIWYGDGGWALMVKIDEPLKVRYFHIGDQIEFGKFAGKVVEIENQRAVVETADGRVELRLGQNLGEARKLEDSST